MQLPGDDPVSHEEGAAHLFPPDLHDVRHLRLKGALLAVWALTSFGVCFFARDLLFSIGGWPVGFWIASQGAVFILGGSQQYLGPSVMLGLKLQPLSVHPLCKLRT